MQAKETATSYRSRKRIFSYEDYLKLPDDHNIYEILEGDLIMTPSPNTSHQDVSRNIGLILTLFVKEKKLGKIYLAPYDVILSDKNIVQPDILYISNKNLHKITEANLQGAPDLIVEILSPGSGYYDLFDKKEIYENFGVLEYWLVDPKRQWVEVYTLNDGKYSLFQRCEKTGQICSALLIDLKLSLETIFE